jgi:hypothetical protein
MVVEVVEKGSPVRHQVMGLEIAQREGKAMVDADDGRNVIGQTLRQPFGQAAPGPVLAGAGWREDLLRLEFGTGFVNPKPFQAGRRRFRAGVVDADMALEGVDGHGFTSDSPVTGFSLKSLADCRPAFSSND